MRSAFLLLLCLLAGIAAAQSQRVETFPVGFIVNGGCVTDLPE